MSIENVRAFGSFDHAENYGPSKADTDKSDPTETSIPNPMDTVLNTIAADSALQTLSQLKDDFQKRVTSQRMTVHQYELKIQKFNVELQMAKARHEYANQVLAELDHTRGKIEEMFNAQTKGLEVSITKFHEYMNKLGKDIHKEDKEPGRAF